VTPPPEYLGTWELIPELSLYAAGTPPASGTYTISRDSAHTLSLIVSWRMPGDPTERTTQFGGPADGSRMMLAGMDGAPDAFTLTHVDERTLDSAAMRGEMTAAYARRVVSSDGSLLAVVQEVVAPDGTRLRNFQVYRRRADVRS